MKLTKAQWLKIKSAARQHELDPHLVGAIVLQESAGMEMAMRFEPKWRFMYKPELFSKLNLTTLETERALQSMSWGLMQIMGTVAREWGHKGPMPELLGIRLNLDIGCRHLKKKLNLYGEPDGIAAYNSGSPQKNSQGKLFNQIYVDRIIKLRGQLSTNTTKFLTS
jgi:soluble lytic murein transglycosylase-like protein